MIESTEERCPSERRGMQGGMEQCTRFIGHEGDHMVEQAGGSSSLKWPNQTDVNFAGEIGLSRDQILTINRALLMYAQSDVGQAPSDEITPRMHEVLTLTTRVDAFSIEDVG